MSTSTARRSGKRRGRLGGLRRLGGRNRQGRGRLILAGIVGLLVLALVLWLLSLFVGPTLQHVRVSGTQLLSPEEVTTVAAAPIGTPLARVSEQEVGERVAALPAVDRVNVRRSWPSTLDIRVTERVPVFGVGDGGAVLLVDRVGASFRGTPPDGLLAGEGPTADPAVLASAAVIVEALPEDLRNTAQKVTFQSKDSVTVQLDGGREVFFGSADEAPLKAEVALALVRGTTADHIDVSSPSRPSTR